MSCNSDSGEDFVGDLAELLLDAGARRQRNVLQRLSRTQEFVLGIHMNRDWMDLPGTVFSIRVYNNAAGTRTTFEISTLDDMIPIRLRGCLVGTSWRLETREWFIHFRIRKICGPWILVGIRLLRRSSRGGGSSALGDDDWCSCTSMSCF